MAANTLTAIMPKILARGLMTLRESCLMPQLVNADYSKEAAKKGATIDVPIPTAVATRDVAPAQVPPEATGTTPTSVAVTLNKWRQTDPIHLTDKEMIEIERNEHFLPMQLQEGVRALANYVNNQIMALYVGVPHFYGAANTIPFNATDKTLHATASRKILNRNLCPKQGRVAVIDWDAEANALTLDAFQRVNEAGSTQTKVEGEIGRKFGIDWYGDHGIPTHTTGAAGTCLVDDAGAVAKGVTQIHVDGLSAKASVGDLFTIAGDTTQYVVTACSDLATNDADITFYPPLVVPLPGGDNNEAITFIATHKVNLVFHRDAIAFATRPLASQSMSVGGSQMVSMQDQKTGLVMRLEVSRQHKQVVWEFDLLFGCALVRPQLACRIIGQP